MLIDDLAIGNSLLDMVCPAESSKPHAAAEVEEI